MHGLPVRVVAVTNVDLKVMLRRTPTDSVSARRRSPRASGSENASRYCRSGIARAAITGGEIGRRHRSCRGGDWVFRWVVDATNDGRNIVGRRTMTPRVPAAINSTRRTHQVHLCRDVTSDVGAPFLDGGTEAVLRNAGCRSGSVVQRTSRACAGSRANSGGIRCWSGNHRRA
jgi:hypothetical protein